MCASTSECVTPPRGTTGLGERSRSDRDHNIRIHRAPYIDDVTCGIWTSDMGICYLSISVLNFSKNYLTNYGTRKTVVPSARLLSRSESFESRDVISCYNFYNPITVDIANRFRDCQQPDLPIDELGLSVVWFYRGVSDMLC